MKTQIVFVIDSPHATVNMHPELPKRSRLLDGLKAIGRAIWMWIQHLRN